MLHTFCADVALWPNRITGDQPAPEVHARGRLGECLAGNAQSRCKEINFLHASIMPIGVFKNRKSLDWLKKIGLAQKLRAAASWSINELPSLRLSRLGPNVGGLVTKGV
jgi:hypothetical protein